MAQAADIGGLPFNEWVQIKEKHKPITGIRDWIVFTGKWDTYIYLFDSSGTYHDRTDTVRLNDTTELTNEHATGGQFTYTTDLEFGPRDVWSDAENATRFDLGMYGRRLTRDFGDNRLYYITERSVYSFDIRYHEPDPRLPQGLDSPGYRILDWQLLFGYVDPNNPNMLAGAVGELPSGNRTTVNWQNAATDAVGILSMPFPYHGHFWARYRDAAGAAVKYGIVYSIPEARGGNISGAGDNPIPWGDMTIYQHLIEHRGLNDYRTPYGQLFNRVWRDLAPNFAYDGVAGRFGWTISSRRFDDKFRLGEIGAGAKDWSSSVYLTDSRYGGSGSSEVAESELNIRVEPYSSKPLLARPVGSRVARSADYKLPIVTCSYAPLVADVNDATGWTWAIIRVSTYKESEGSGLYLEIGRSGQNITDSLSGGQVDVLVSLSDHGLGGSRAFRFTPHREQHNQLVEEPYDLPDTLSGFGSMIAIPVNIADNVDQPDRNLVKVREIDRQVLGNRTVVLPGGSAGTVDGEFLSVLQLDNPPREVWGAAPFTFIYGGNDIVPGITYTLQDLYKDPDHGNMWLGTFKRSIR